MSNEDSSQATNEELLGDKAEAKSVDVKEEKTEAVSDSKTDAAPEVGSDKAESQENKDESQTVDSKFKAEDFEVKEEQLSKDELNLFVEKAEKLGLTKEQTQALLSDTIQDRVKTQESIQTQVNELKASWLDAVKKDAEIGGAKFTESAEYAKRALDEFGSKDLKEFLDGSGFGNYPELIRAFSKMGKMLANDKFVSGTPSVSNTPKPVHKLFYPDK